ncbi:Uncharacterized protein SCF082_LOCUS2681 [Durusdinium trenchii]|uniref:Uncharacterized protein n=1 Tax=Durusdinium trenchii TaxID=1381693 RepID=A0ABP0HNN2_9DINO
MALELPPDDDVGPEILMEKGTLSMSCPVVDLVTPSRATDSDLPEALLGGALHFNAESLNQSNPVAAAELMGAGAKDSGLQPRHLQHMSMEGFYELYRLWAGNAEPTEIAGSRLFASIYQERIRKASLQPDRQQLEKAQSEHIKNVRMYRQTQSRLNALSEQATGTNGSSTSILKLDIDGLDQSKTRYPRLNSINPKSLTNAWRPQIHVLGCIIWGVVESYFVLEPDVPKDSSTEITCILRALDQAKEILDKRGIPIPEHLIIEDFVKLILEKVTPSRKRELRAEILTGSLNWKQYYDQYEIQMSGLDLPLYDDRSGDSWKPTEIPKEDYKHCDTDCILLVKHLVNSQSLSQPPLTLLPAEFLKKIQQELESLPRNILSDRAKKEWERFAPGPVQPVYIAPAKIPAPEDGEPKKRGRPPKVRDPNDQGQGAAAEIFVEQAGAAPIAIPPVEEEVELGPGQDMVLQPVVDNPPPPTRSTFAGRTKSGSEEYQNQWMGRREMYYKFVPVAFWKDPSERQYWTLCNTIGDKDKAMQQFLDQIGVKRGPPAPAPKAAAVPKAKCKAKAQAKAQAKRKAEKNSGPGRRPGVKSSRGKAAYR